LLACTHYPLLKNKIEQYVPSSVKVVSQGDIVVESLKNYLQRHTEIEEKISTGGQLSFYTTDSAEDFNAKASIFFGERVDSTHLDSLS
jgi:glutamate racemase